MPRRNFDASMVARLREDQAQAAYLRRQRLVTASPSSSGSNNILINPQTTNYNASSQTQAQSGLENIFINGSLRNMFTIGCACETVASPSVPAPLQGIASWAVSQTSTGSATVYDSKTDPFGNVYMTIGYAGILRLNEFVSDATDPITLSTYGTFLSSRLANCLVKYDSNGQILWATNITRINGSFRATIDFDSAGNVYLLTSVPSVASTINNFVSGGAGAPVNVTPFGTIIPPPGVNYYSLLVKYSESGQALWATKIVASSQVRAPSLSVTPTGDVYVTGNNDLTTYIDFYNQNGVFMGDVQPVLYGRIVCTANNTPFLVKYNSGGYVDWATKIDSLSGVLKGVHVAPDGTVYVKGVCLTGPLSFYNWSSTAAGVVNTTLSGTLAFSAIYAFLAKYSSTGALQWATTITPGIITKYNPMGITVDNDSNVYISGCYTSLATFDNFVSIDGAFAITTVPYNTLPAPAAGFDMYIVKYSPSGQVVWNTRIANAGSVNAGSLATDGTNVYVGGLYTGAIGIYNSDASLFGTMQLESATSYLLVKYSGQGIGQWATNGTGRGSSVSSTVSVSYANGSVYLGETSGVLTASRVNRNGGVVNGGVDNVYYNSVMGMGMNGMGILVSYRG